MYYMNKILQTPRSFTLSRDLPAQRVLASQLAQASVADGGESILDSIVDGQNIGRQLFALLDAFYESNR